MSEHEEIGISKERIALAKVGINALIDEATGYQEQRFQQEGSPLREMFEGFMESEEGGDETEQRA